jgi:hypothetical protein
MAKPIYTTADPDIHSNRSQGSKKENTPSPAPSRLKDSFYKDDVIVALSDAYENRRARQVTEWEMRQHIARIL